VKSKFCQNQILYSPFCLNDRDSSQLTGVGHFFATSSPLVSVLGIIDAQASLHILFHHFIPRPFRSSSLHMSWISFHTLLINFVLFILSRCPSHLSLVFPRWCFISATPVLSLSKPFGIHHEASFYTSSWSFSFLLPAFVWCQPSSSPNIQIHSTSHILHKLKNYAVTLL